jgi:hypothetical protein
VGEKVSLRVGEKSAETYLSELVGVEVGVHERVTSSDGLIDCAKGGETRNKVSFS